MAKNAHNVDPNDPSTFPELPTLKLVEQRYLGDGKRWLGVAVKPPGGTWLNVGAEFIIDYRVDPEQYLEHPAAKVRCYAPPDQDALEAHKITCGVWWGEACDEPYPGGCLVPKLQAAGRTVVSAPKGAKRGQIVVP